MKWLFVEGEGENVQTWNYLFTVTVLIAVKNVLFKIISYVIEGFMKGWVSLTQVDPLSIFSLMCCITIFLFVYTHKPYTHIQTHMLYILWTLWEKAAHHDPPYPIPPIFTSQEQGVFSQQLQLVSNTWLPLTLSAWLVFIPFTSVSNPDTEMGWMNNSTI